MIDCQKSEDEDSQMRIWEGDDLPTILAEATVFVYENNLPKLKQTLGRLLDKESVTAAEITEVVYTCAVADVLLAIARGELVVQPYEDSPSQPGD